MKKIYGVTLMLSISNIFSAGDSHPLLNNSLHEEKEARLIRAVVRIPDNHEWFVYQICENGYSRRSSEDSLLIETFRIGVSKEWNYGQLLGCLKHHIETFLNADFKVFVGENQQNLDSEINFKKTHIVSITQK